MNIQEVCKIRKEELKLTYQEISDTSGVPLSTVQNFFSKFSKAPSIYTVAPICKALGISLDMVGNLLVTVAAALLDILDRRKQPVCHLLSGLLLDVARDDAKRLVSRKIKRGDVINGTLRGHTAQLCADVSVSCIHGDYIRRGLAELWRKQGVGASLPRFRPDF